MFNFNKIFNKISEKVNGAETKKLSEEQVALLKSKLEKVQEALHGLKPEQVVETLKNFEEHRRNLNSAADLHIDFSADIDGIDPYTLWSALAAVAALVASFPASQYLSDMYDLSESSSLLASLIAALGAAGAGGYTMFTYLKSRLFTKEAKQVLKGKHPEEVQAKKDMKSVEKLQKEERKLKEKLDIDNLKSDIESKI